MCIVECLSYTVHRSCSNRLCHQWAAVQMARSYGASRLRSLQSPLYPIWSSHYRASFSVTLAMVTTYLNLWRSSWAMNLAFLKLWGLEHDWSRVEKACSWVWSKSLLRRLGTKEQYRIFFNTRLLFVERTTPIPSCVSLYVRAVVSILLCWGRYRGSDVSNYCAVNDV